jgi:hypothetical protein
MQLGHSKKPVEYLRTNDLARIVAKKNLFDKKRTVRVAFPTPMGLRNQSGGGSKKEGWWSGE